MDVSHRLGNLITFQKTKLKCLEIRTCVFWHFKEKVECAEKQVYT